MKDRRVGSALWPGMVFAFLGLNVAVVATTVVLAGRDESAAVVPGYDVKALGWDARQHELAAQRRLGWTLSLRVRTEAAEAELVARPMDAQGSLLRGAEVLVEAFHNAHPKHVLPLRPALRGEEFACPAPFALSGMWTFRVLVRSGAQEVAFERELIVTPEGGR